MIKTKHDYMTTREKVIEFLIQNQPFIKERLSDLNSLKDKLLLNESPIFKDDIKNQYEARIKQWIAFYTADSLAIPAEDVIIELERIELDEFIAV